MSKCGDKNLYFDCWAARLAPRLVFFRLPCDGHHLGKKKCQQKTTWRYSVMTELSEVKRTLDEVQHAAQKGINRGIVVALIALCFTENKEDSLSKIHVEVEVSVPSRPQLFKCWTTLSNV